MSVSVGDIRTFLQDHVPVEASDDAGLARAAVLFLFFERNGSLDILLTQRTDSVEHHKGQVSFPGGMMDDGDRHAEDTALREAEEEIGLERSIVEIVGRTDDLVTPTGFAITPVIGILKGEFPFRLSKDEVEAVFFVPVSVFFDPSVEEAFEREWEGQSQIMYSYQYGKFRIWGATAHIIRTFLRNVVTRPVGR